MIETLATLTGLSNETIIDLLPFILIEIRNYTNQYFLTETHSAISKIENNIIYTNDGSQFQVGDIVELMNSENNVLIYIIDTITGNNITCKETLSNETNNSNMVMIKLSFKNVNFKTISSMISYDNKFGITSGIKSQTLGAYNVTFATPTGGNTIYPIELYGGVNALKKINDDFAEYRRKGYVRL
jgi:hypothetical protein